MKHPSLHTLLGFTALLLLASCYGEGEPLPPPVEPEPAPEPEPTPQPGIDLSLCCDLYKAFVQDGEQGKETTLLDFSYAGYEHGERSVPQVDYPEVRVDDYGAVPDDNLSDREALEEAIRAAEALAATNGRGAVVRFSAGRYDLRTADAPNSSITITGSNIVLRGATAAEGTTELYMEYPNQAVDNTLWNTPELITMTYKGAQKDDAVKLTDVTGNAARGSHTIEVASASGLSVGQRVLLKLTNNDPALVADEVKPYDIEGEWSELPQQGVQVTEYHAIARVEGNRITFKEPLTHKVEAQWGWTLHRHQHNVGCGVEDITFRGNYRNSFVHHGSALDDSGFRMLTLHRQVNGWVRRCHFIDVSEAVSVMLSANVSVSQCTLSGNGGHSAIRSQASSCVFIGKCSDLSGQYHSFGVSKTANGSVLWRNTNASTTCFESHSSQPRATLIDACSGGFLPNHAGGDASAGPNHLADLVLWNYKETGNGAGTFDLWVRNNRFLMPIFAGYQGTTRFKPEQVTADESHGRAVYPESLYEAQLIYRLGYLPDWIQALKQ